MVYPTTWVSLCLFVDKHCQKQSRGRVYLRVTNVTTDFLYTLLGWIYVLPNPCYSNGTRLQAASSVLHTTSCKHSLVLMRMGEIIARNMLNWLKSLIKLLLLYLVGCLYDCVNDARLHKHQIYRVWKWGIASSDAG